jgi:hypothetical protein
MAATPAMDFGRFAGMSADLEGRRFATREMVHVLKRRNGDLMMTVDAAECLLIAISFCYRFANMAAQTGCEESAPARSAIFGSHRADGHQIEFMLLFAGNFPGAFQRWNALARKVANIGFNLIYCHGNVMDITYLREFVVNRKTSVGDATCVFSLRAQQAPSDAGFSPCS